MCSRTVVAKSCASTKSEVLPPRVAQHVAEGVHAAAAFVAEVEVIRGVVHLRLKPRGGLEPPHGRDDRTGAQPQHPFGEDRVPSGITESAQFLVDPSDRDVGVARQQVGDRRFVGVELAARAPSRRAARARADRRGPARPAPTPDAPCGG